MDIQLVTNSAPKQPCLQSERIAGRSSTAIQIQSTDRMIVCHIVIEELLDVKEALESDNATSIPAANKNQCRFCDESNVYCRSIPCTLNTDTSPDTPPQPMLSSQELQYAICTDCIEEILEMISYIFEERKELLAAHYI